MASSSIHRRAATLALLLGLGGCAFMPGFDADHAAQVQKAGGLPKGNLVPALIGVGDKAADAGDREAAVRIYGRAAAINPEHPDTAQAIARAAQLVGEMPAPRNLPRGVNEIQSVPGNTLPALSGSSTSGRRAAGSPDWSQPREAAKEGEQQSAPARQVDQGKASGDAAETPTVQIKIIDLKDKNKDTSIAYQTTITGQDTAESPAAGGATEQGEAVPAPKSNEDHVASNGIPVHEDRNSSAKAQSGTPESAKAESAKAANELARKPKPVVAPPPLPAARRSSEAMLNNVATADPVPGDTPIGIDSEHQKTTLHARKNAKNSASDVAEDDASPDPRLAERSADARAAYRIAAELSRESAPATQVTATQVTATQVTATQVTATQVATETTDTSSSNGASTSASEIAAAIPASDEASAAPHGNLIPSDKMIGLDAKMISGSGSRTNPGLQDGSGLTASALSAAETAEVKPVAEVQVSEVEAGKVLVAKPPIAAPIAESGSAAEGRIEPAAGNTAAGTTPEASPLATPSHASAVAVGSGYQVQLAAYRSPALANQGWNRIKIASQGALDVTTPVVIRAEIPDQGTVYRLRIGGFEARGDARELCTALKSKFIDCFVAAAEQGTSGLEVAETGPAAAGSRS